MGALYRIHPTLQRRCGDESWHPNRIERRRNIMLNRTLLKMMCLVVFTGAVLVSASRVVANQEHPPATNSPAFQAYVMKEVRHQLITLPFYTVFDNLQYQVQGTKVILLGQVTNPTLKSDAGKAVKSIEGVQAVENSIEVL